MLAMRLYVMAVALAGYLGMCSFAFAQARPKPCAYAEAGTELRVDLAGFTVRTFKDREYWGCVQVLRAGTVVYERSNDGRFYLQNGFDDDEVKRAPRIPLGLDITGRGKPNLLLAEWTGGVHCCYVFHVLELGETVREIAVADLQHSIDGYLRDLDGDGVMEIIARDYTFAYWRGSFAFSPAPPIVLRFRDGKYELAPELMRKAAPTESEFADMPKKVRSAEFPVQALAGMLLELIYSGHSDMAWRLASLVRVGREPDFLSGFCSQLSGSPYFGKLRPTLGKAPCEFAEVR
jgi:hypothetical protein